VVRSERRDGRCVFAAKQNRNRHPPYPSPLAPGGEGRGGGRHCPGARSGRRGWYWIAGCFVGTESFRFFRGLLLFCFFYSFLNPKQSRQRARVGRFASPAYRSRSFLPRLEILEDRHVPSTLTLATLSKAEQARSGTPSSTPIVAT